MREREFDDAGSKCDDAEDARLEKLLQDLLRRVRDRANEGKGQVKVLIKEFIEKSDF